MIMISLNSNPESTPFLLQPLRLCGEFHRALPTTDENSTIMATVAIVVAKVAGFLFLAIITPFAVGLGLIGCLVSPSRATPLHFQSDNLRSSAFPAHFELYRLGFLDSSKNFGELLESFSANEVKGLFTDKAIGEGISTIPADAFERRVQLTINNSTLNRLKNYLLHTFDPHHGSFPENTLFFAIFHSKNLDEGRLQEFKNFLQHFTTLEFSIIASRLPVSGLLSDEVTTPYSVTLTLK